MPTPFTLLSIATARETERSGWHRRDAGAYDAAYANAIEEPVATQPDRLLAAIPSPFGRLHGFDVAFGFLSEPNRPVEGESVFHASVSQCLDAMELVFNWQTHLMCGAKLALVRWHPSQELDRLKKGRPGHAVLAEALELYFGQDTAIGAHVREDGLWLIAAEEGTHRSALVVASPLTIAAPAPEAAALAAQIDLRMPGRKYVYFSTTVPLSRRPPAFQAYMRALFRLRQGALTRGCERMFTYVNRVVSTASVAQALARFTNANYVQLVDPSDGLPIAVHGVHLPTSAPSGDVDEEVATSPRRIRVDRPGVTPLPVMLVDHVTSTGQHDMSFKAPASDARPVADRVLPDLKRRYPFLIAADLFEDQIIRVPYALNTAAFLLPAASKDVTASFLPPVRRAYLEYFDETSIPTRVRFRPLDGAGVACDIDVPLVHGSVTLSKSYYPTPQLPSAGRIVDADVDLIAFPMMRPAKMEDGRPVAAFGDLSAFLLVELERSQAAHVPWRSDLAFYTSTPAPDGERFALQPIVDRIGIQERTKKATPSYTGSKMFHLDRPLPTAIELVLTEENGRKTRALLCPAARPQPVGSAAFDIAIDFGTTNTFIALGRRRGDGRAPDVLPLAFTGGSEPTLALHAPNQSGQPIVAHADKLANHEFVPLGLGTGRYTLPTRTAVAERPDGHAQRLFADINVAFFLQRDAVRAGAEVVTTHLKWMRRAETATIDRVRLFLREMLHLVRARILQQGGDPRESTLIWFWPLSFTTYLRNTLERLWREEAVAVLGVDASAVGSMTESAAPFYYHHARARLVSDKPVLSIDIGGGSTDVVFFERQTPRFGTSFNFAGNALWGDGFNLVRGPSDRNGIVDWALPRVNDTLSRLDSPIQLHAREILSPLTTSLESSEDAVNLCFAVDEQVKFTQQLATEPVIKLMILLHFSAVIFHCAQVMRLRKLRRPEILCFSGYGSKSLDVLDPSSGKRHLGEQALRLFDVVYDHWDRLADVAVADDPASADAIIGIARELPSRGSLQILLADRLKEATCEGGILGAALGNALRDTPEPFVYLGGADDTLYERDRVVSYEELERCPSIKPDVAANFRRFIAVFLGFADRYEPFDVPIGTVADHRTRLWIQVSETLELGLERRLKSEEGREERMSETLFFYPLIDKLFRISQTLKP